MSRVRSARMVNSREKIAMNAVKAQWQCDQLQVSSIKEANMRMLGVVGVSVTSDMKMTSPDDVTVASYR